MSILLSCFNDDNIQYNVFRGDSGEWSILLRFLETTCSGTQGQTMYACVVQTACVKKNVSCQLPWKWIRLRPNGSSRSETQWVARKRSLIHKKATCVCLRLSVAASYSEAQERTVDLWPAYIIDTFYFLRTNSLSSHTFMFVGVWLLHTPGRVQGGFCGVSHPPQLPHVQTILLPLRTYTGGSIYSRILPLVSVFNITAFGREIMLFQLSTRFSCFH